jgi:hypothetical protein
VSLVDRFVHCQFFLENTHFISLFPKKYNDTILLLKIFCVNEKADVFSFFV